MGERRITSLKDVETLEVSLVEAGANLKKRFPILKSRGNTTMDKILVEVLKAEGQSDAMQKLESILKMEMPDDAKKAVMAAMKLLEAYSDMMPIGEALAALRDASGEKVEEKEEVKIEAAQDEFEEGKESEGTKLSDEERLLKSVELPASARAALEAIWKSNQDLVKKSEKLETELGVEIAKRARREYIAKAEKTLCNVPGHSLDQIVDLVIDAKARNGELGARVEKALEAASAALQGGPLLVEAGRSIPDMNAGDPWAKIQAVAKSEMESSGGSLTMPQAITKAIQTNPALYAEYSDQRSKNGGR